MIYVLQANQQALLVVARSLLSVAAASSSSTQQVHQATLAASFELLQNLSGMVPGGSAAAQPSAIPPAAALAIHEQQAQQSRAQEQSPPAAEGPGQQWDEALIGFSNGKTVEGLWAEWSQERHFHGVVYPPIRTMEEAHQRQDVTTYAPYSRWRTGSKRNHFSARHKIIRTLLARHEEENRQNPTHPVSHEDVAKMLDRHKEMVVPGKGLKAYAEKPGALEAARSVGSGSNE